jgi:hypothetical protein
MLSVRVQVSCSRLLHQQYRCGTLEKGTVSRTRWHRSSASARGVAAAVVAALLLVGCCFCCCSAAAPPVGGQGRSLRRASAPPCAASRGVARAVLQRSFFLSFFLKSSSHRYCSPTCACHTRPAKPNRRNTSCRPRLSGNSWRSRAWSSSCPAYPGRSRA